MIDIEFVLPFPPSVNGYYVKTRSGIFISSKGRAFRQDSLEAVINQLGSIDTIMDPILMEVTLYPPDKRKRDLDNYMKCLLDAITHTGLWEDDSLINQLFIYRGVVTKGSGSVFISISDAGPILPKQ